MSRIHFSFILISFLISPALISTCQGARLLWDENSESDLKGYKVYYRNPSEYYDESVIDVGMLTEHKLRNIKEGLTYYLSVTAYDFSGNESHSSEEVHYLVNDGVPDDGGDHACATGETENCDDNCPNTPNGPEAGTCAIDFAGIVIGTGITCTSDTDCEDGETCQMDQEDYNNNGIGDVCECYADFNEDCQVTAPDYFLMKKEYGRYDCDQNPCQADANQDGKVTAPDYFLMIKEFGRYDCCQR